jgi:type VI secretion system protein ImpC
MAKKEQSESARLVETKDELQGLQAILQQTITGSGVDSKTAETWVDTLLGDVDTLKVIRHEPRMMDAIDERIRQIDAALSQFVNLVLHDKKFQKFEGSWRGLADMVRRSTDDEQPFMRIQVLPLTKEELVRDGKRADYQESELFKKIYLRRFNTYGAIPLAAMIGDFEWSHEKEDIDGLSFMANIGSMAHCPFVTAPSPKLLGLKKSESWDQLQDAKFKSIDDRINSPDNPEMNRYRAFREMEDSRYITMCMPRVLARVPYGKGESEQSVTGFDYQEFPLADDANTVQLSSDKYCWSNAAYAMGACMIESFFNTGWGSNITGIESGGMIEDLPVHNYLSDRGDVKTMCPTEFSLAGVESKTMSNVGLLPLLWEESSPRAFFQGTETVHKPKFYSKSEKGNAATSNARLSSRLPYIMAVSRVVHWMQPRLMHMIGKRMDAAEIEKSLNEWLNDNLVEPGTDPGEEAKAKKPFKSGEITVKEDPRNPGAFFVSLKLTPHIFIEEIDLGVSLVARRVGDK